MPSNLKINVTESTPQNSKSTTATSANADPLLTPTPPLDFFVLEVNGVRSICETHMHLFFCGEDLMACGENSGAMLWDLEDAEIVAVILTWCRDRRREYEEKKAFSRFLEHSSNLVPITTKKTRYGR